MSFNRMFLISVIGVLSSACSSAAHHRVAQDMLSEYTGNARPEIIEVFACSDYCPGPESKYLVKAYKGVTDPETCTRLGGRPYEYVGWGRYFVCIAE